MTQKTVRRVRHRRRHGVGYFISLIVLTALCALILLPIVFTFLYSFFPMMTDLRERKIPPNKIMK